MIAVSRRYRRRSSGALAVLAVLYLGAAGACPASATDAGQAAVAAASSGSMTVSVRAQVSAPASPQEPHDATVTLDYTLTNTGLLPIRQVLLEDPLVPGGHVACDGSHVVQVLPVGSSVACRVSLSLPPGSYVSRPQAHGWIYVLILAFPVAASARTAFSVPPPPPPPPPPPSSPPPSSPPSSLSPTPAASTAPPSPRTQVPATSASPARTPPTSPPPTPPATKTATPAPRQVTPSLAPLGRPVRIPSVPAAQVRRLPTHVTVLLLLLPAAVGAAVAGAAALRRR